MADIAMQTNPRARAVLSQLIGRAHGISVSGKLRRDAALELRVTASPVLDYFWLSRWHVIRRRRALRLAMQTAGLAPASATAAETPESAFTA